MSNTPDVLTFDVTSVQAKEWHEKRAQAHEHAATEWEKRAADPVWCQYTAMENQKTLFRNAEQAGTRRPDKVPDAKGIATFALETAKTNLENAAYVRSMGAAITPDRTFHLTRDAYQELIGDISKKILPIDPPALADQPAAAPATAQPS